MNFAIPFHLIPRVLASSAVPAVPIPSFFSVCTTGSGSPFQCVLEKILDLLLSIATPIVAIMVVIGGIQIMMASGNAEKITSGKKTITYAVVGYAILLLASSIPPIISSLLAP